MSKSQSPTQMVEVNGLQCVERGGEFWFPGAEIGRLVGYSDPVRAISKVYHRHVQQLQEHTGLVIVTTPGGKQEVRVFDEEATYFLVMRSETEKASEICMQFAATLKELRRQKLAEQEQRIKALEGEKVLALEQVLQLSPSERERLPKVVRYRRMGLSFKEIAKLLDCGRDTVRVMAVRARELGLLQEEEGVVKGPRKLDASERAFILEERRKGRTYATIARALGRNKDTVRVFYLRDGAAPGGDHA